MNKVVFFTSMEQLPEAFSHFDVSSFSNQPVLMKLHMGEAKNKFYIRPSFVKRVIDYFKDRESSPFLYDTTVLYNSKRKHVDGYKKVASSHGFHEEEMGIPMVIDDDGIPVEVEGYDFEVGTTLHKHSHIICLSHVKGHVATGMGGAIKNFGMGGVTPATKKMIHHGSKPVFNSDKCRFCGMCAEVCPFHAISVEKENWKVHSTSCFGCGVCVENCPSDALAYVDDHIQYLLACATKACVDQKQVLYINDINRIADSCDCDPGAKDIICPDVGYCMASDPVAIDHASLTLIDERKKDVFQQRLHVDPYQQTRFGEQIGLGSTTYSLVRL